MRHPMPASPVLLLLVAHLPGAVLLGLTTPHASGCRPLHAARFDPGGRRGRFAVMAADDDDNQRLIDALFGNASPDGPEPNRDEPSHMHLERDERGEPMAARFTYVDEESCIGCTHCSHVARNTFFMEDDYGRARVYNQQGDTSSEVMEAIDTCPVNCIHFVSHEDLVVLEKEREGMVINFKERLARSGGESTGTSFSLASGSFQGGCRCNNCPSRGCKSCPMFGVGENPVYLERVAEREARAKARGTVARAEEQERRNSLIDQLFGVDGASADSEGEGAVDGRVYAIFDDEYTIDDDEANAAEAGGGDAADGVVVPTGGGGIGGLARKFLGGGGGEAGLAKGGGDDRLARAGEAGATGGRAADEQAERARARPVNVPLAESYYKILGVKRGASRSDVKRAYYGRAKLYHPDTTDGDASRNPTAAKKFKELTDAYAIICEELLECDVGEVTEDIIDAASGRGAEEADGPKAGLPGFGKTGR